MNGLEAKAKLQTTTKYIRCDAQTIKGTKGVVQKQAKGKWQ